MSEKKGQEITITRAAVLPDRHRMARYRKAPELGSKILFFSGGTALQSLSQLLIHYTHNSVHLMTAFDSGGSSAKLRQAFHMLSVGDVRNRLLALADPSVPGYPDISRLFVFRLPQDGSRQDLYYWLQEMAAGTDPLVAQILEPMRSIIRHHLWFLLKHMPSDFDLRGASIGNLILAGGYLQGGLDIDAVIFLLSRVLEVRGIVRPIVTESLDLAVILEDGHQFVGQHLLTGKEVPPIRSPVQKLYLTKDQQTADPVEITIRQPVQQLIQEADLICYPMGSFYSSLIANLLPKGVGQAISENTCPKVYIPNTGTDPEQLGLSLARSVETLLTYLQQSCYRRTAPHRLLNFVLLDSQNTMSLTAQDLGKIQQMGIKIIDTSLITSEVTGHS